jgi:hypothetical protein
MLSSAYTVTRTLRQAGDDETPDMIILLSV